VIFTPFFNRLVVHPNGLFCGLQINIVIMFSPILVFPPSFFQGGESGFFSGDVNSPPSYAFRDVCLTPPHREFVVSHCHPPHHFCPPHAFLLECCHCFCGVAVGVCVLGTVLVPSRDFFPGLVQEP